MAVNVEETKAYVEELIKRSRIAQKKFEREYNTQRAIDEVVRAIGMACNIAVIVPAPSSHSP